MYWKVAEASWLNATYGLIESMPELVPILKVPPVFAELLEEPPQPASTSAQGTATSANSHRFLILPSFSRLEERFFECERTPVGVERIPHAERNRGEVLPVPGRGAVENGD